MQSDQNFWKKFRLKGKFFSPRTSWPWVIFHAQQRGAQSFETYNLWKNLQRQTVSMATVEIQTASCQPYPRVSPPAFFQMTAFDAFLQFPNDCMLSLTVRKNGLRFRTISSTFSSYESHLATHHRQSFKAKKENTLCMYTYICTAYVLNMYEPIKNDYICTPRSGANPTIVT
jgi:hypothetical protein